MHTSSPVSLGPLCQARVLLAWSLVPVVACTVCIPIYSTLWIRHCSSPLFANTLTRLLILLTVCMPITSVLRYSRTSSSSSRRSHVIMDPLHKFNKREGRGRDAACCARAAHLACNQHAWFAAGRDGDHGDQVSCDRLCFHGPDAMFMYVLPSLFSFWSVFSSEGRSN